MNILLTGSTGFLGSHLKKTLQKRHKLYLLGRNISDGSIADISDNKEIGRCMKSSEVVIHCAAINKVKNDKGSKNKDELYNTNVLLTKKLVQAAIESGVRRFIFISTLKVNGERTASKPFNYSDPVAPEDGYAKSKANAEKELIEMASHSSLDFVIIRPPMIYGANVKSNFTSLLNYVANEYPLPFKLITKNKRSMVSVRNLVNLIEVCLSHPNASNQIFLVSDDNDISTHDLIMLLSKCLGKKPHMIPIPKFIFKILGKLTFTSKILDKLIDSLQADISHTKTTLEWSPPFSLEQTILETRKNVKSN